MSKINKIEQIVNGIRTKMAERAVHFDADSEEKKNQNNQNKGKKGGKKGGKKSTGLGTRLPYGLCKDLGIDTTGMSPKEAWDAYYGETGVKPKDAIEMKIEKGPEKIDPKGEKENKTENENSDPDGDVKKENRPEETTGSEIPQTHVQNNEQEIRDIRKGISEKIGIPEGDPVWDEFDKYCTEEDIQWIYDAYHSSRGEHTLSARNSTIEDEKELAEKYARIKELEGQKGGTEEEQGERSIDEVKRDYINSIDDNREASTKLFDENSGKNLESAFRYVVCNRKENKLGKELEELGRREREAKKEERKDVYESLSEDEKKKYEKRRPKEIEDRVKELNDELTSIYLGDDPYSGENIVKTRDLIREKLQLDDEKKEVEQYKSDRELNERKSESYVSTEVKFDYTTPVMQEYSSKVPKPVMATEIKSLKGWAEKATVWGDTMMAHNGMLFGIDNADDLVKVRDKFQEMVDNAELLCNTNSAHLESIVTNHLMNQFESGTTGGSDDLGARRRAAESLFGLGKSSAIDREKYGYMMDRGNYEQTLGASGPSYGYGWGGHQCAIVMRKDKVADRTTYTADDSLFSAANYPDEYAAGAVDKNVSLEGMSYDSRIPQRILNGEYNSLSDMVYSYGGSGITGYFECQFHGVISGPDIEAIRFRSKKEMKEVTDQWGDTMWEAVKTSKIKVEYFDDDYEIQSGYDDDYNSID